MRAILINAVLLIARNKVTTETVSVHRPQLLKREPGEPRQNRLEPAEVLLLQCQPNALPLGLSGSLGHTTTQHTLLENKIWLPKWQSIV